MREAVGIAAYHAGEWRIAVSELRAWKRFTGSDAHLAVIADSERALGRPEKAIALADSPDVQSLDLETRVELLIVAAGAAQDLGDPAAAVERLRIPELRSHDNAPWAARLRYAYAEALLAAGAPDEEARAWFLAAAEVDDEHQTDAGDRALDLDGVLFIETDDVDADGVETDGVETDGVDTDEDGLDQGGRQADVGDAHGADADEAQDDGQFDGADAAAVGIGDQPEPEPRHDPLNPTDGGNGEFAPAEGSGSDGAIERAVVDDASIEAPVETGEVENGTDLIAADETAIGADTSHDAVEVEPPKTLGVTPPVDAAADRDEGSGAVDGAGHVGIDSDQVGQPAVTTGMEGTAVTGARPGDDAVPASGESTVSAASADPGLEPRGSLGTAAREPDRPSPMSFLEAETRDLGGPEIQPDEAVAPPRQPG